MRNIYKYIFGFSFITILSVSFVYISLNNTKIKQNPFADLYSESFNSISGVPKDVRLEKIILASSGSSHTEERSSAKDVENYRFSKPTEINFDQEQSYEIAYSLFPNNSDNIVDLSVSIYKQNGMFGLQALGLKSNSEIHIRVNNEVLLKNGKPDWSGQFKTLEKNDLVASANAKICFDIGGYRGNTITTCHNMDKGHTIHPVSVASGGAAESCPDGSNPDDCVHETYHPMALHFDAQTIAVTQSTTDRIARRSDLELHHDYATQMGILRAEAVLSVQPTQHGCEMATLAGTLGAPEQHSSTTSAILAGMLLDRASVTGAETQITSTGSDSDRVERAALFTDSGHCSPGDSMGAGESVCPQGTENTNADIDVSRIFTGTLDICPQDGDFSSDDERNTLSLLFNLMPHEFPTVPAAATVDTRFQDIYQQYRSQMATLGIVRSIYSDHIARRSACQSGSQGDTSPYFRAYLREMGLSGEAIESQYGSGVLSYRARIDALTQHSLSHRHFTDLAGMDRAGASRAYYTSAALGMQLRDEIQRLEESTRMAEAALSLRETFDTELAELRDAQAQLVGQQTTE